MDPRNFETIVNWQKFENVKDVKAFIKFANFYQQFINNFFALISPFIIFTCKNKAFVFNKKCKKAFAYLKIMFITTPVLQHFNLNQISVIKTDLSDYVIKSILSQYNKEKVLHFMAYFLKQLSPAKCNYKIYNKKLLAIIRCFKQ